MTTTSTLEAAAELNTSAQLLLFQIAEKRPKIQRSLLLEGEDLSSLTNKIDDLLEDIEALTARDIAHVQKEVLSRAEEKFNRALYLLAEPPTETKQLEALLLAEEAALVCKDQATAGF